MGQVYGYNTWFGWGEESTYGTAVAAAKYAEIEKESYKDDGSRFQPKPLLRFRSQNRKILDKANPAGVVTLPMTWTGLEQILEHALGSVVTTGPVSSLYTHTYALAAQLPTGLTVFINRDSEGLGGNTCFRISGSKINKLTLRQNVGEWLMADIEFLGKLRTQTTKPTPTFPTFDATDWAMVATKAINPGGSNFNIPARSVEIMIDNGLHPDGYRLGSRSRELLGAGDGQRKVNFKIEAEFNDNALYTPFLNSVATDLSFVWRKDPTQAASSSNPELTITLPAVVFDGEDPAIESPGPKYQTISGTCLLSSVDNDELALVLKNTTSSV